MAKKDEWLNIYNIKNFIFYKIFIFLNITLSGLYLIKWIIFKYFLSIFINLFYNNYCLNT